MLITPLPQRLKALIALHNLYFLKEGGLFFSSEALGLVFSAMYLWGSLTPLPPSGGISPTDKLRKDSALRLGRAFRLRALGREARRKPPVASEKSTLFSWVTNIVRLCKDLDLLLCI